jgi:thiol-disulfide isomerase/thioredoxin
MKKTLLAFLVAATLAFSADVNRPSPEFSVHMTDGTQKLLSSYKGKVVVLAFFFTTCPHCQNVAQLLGPIQQEYGPKGVQVLSGCFNDNAANLVGDFNKSYVHDAFPVGWDDRLSVLEYLKLGPSTPFFVPILVFVDRKGVIRSQYIGDETYLKDPNKSIRASLDELLKGPAVSRAATTSHKNNK